MAAIPQHDWITLENEFVAGEMSMRALAMLHGVKPGTLAKHANRPDVTGKTWHEKRAQRQTMGKDKAITKLAEGDANRAVKEARVRDAALDMIYDAIELQRAQWREVKYVEEHDADGAEIWVARPRYPVNTVEIRELLDRLVALAGRPMVLTANAGGDGVDLSITGDVPEGDARTVLSELAARIRAGRRTPVGPVGGRAEPDPDGS